MNAFAKRKVLLFSVTVILMVTWICSNALYENKIQKTTVSMRRSFFA